MLYRKITSYIEDYLKSDTDNILIVEGARQIGKSFSIREVGTRNRYIKILSKFLLTSPVFFRDNKT